MKIERKDRRYYMNISNPDSPIWTPVGVGFSKFKEEKNTSILKRRFFHESDSRVLNKGYSSSIEYDFDIYSDSLAAERLREICDNEMMFEEGKVEVLCVDYFRPTDTPDVYYANVRRYSVIPEISGGEGDSLRYAGKLWADGNMIPGVFVRSTGTFLPG